MASQNCAAGTRTIGAIPAPSAATEFCTAVTRSIELCSSRSRAGVAKNWFHGVSPSNLAKLAQQSLTSIEHLGERNHMEERNRQVLLKRRPTGPPTAADFEIAEGPVPDPEAGEVLVRGIYLSLDPYMRGRISGARSYAKPVEVGAVIEGHFVGRVVRSRDPAFARVTTSMGVTAGSSSVRHRRMACSNSTPPRPRYRQRLACSACRGLRPMSG